MSFYLTKLPAIPIGFDQLLERVGKSRITLAKSFGRRQRPEKTLLRLLEIALPESIITGIKKFPPFLIHRSAPHDEI